MTDVVWRGKSRDNTRHHSHTPPQSSRVCCPVYSSSWRARAGKREFGIVPPRVIFRWKLSILAKPSGMHGDWVCRSRAIRIHEQEHLFFYFAVWFKVWEGPLTSTVFSPRLMGLSELKDTARFDCVLFIGATYLWIIVR